MQKFGKLPKLTKLTKQITEKLNRYQIDPFEMAEILSDK